MILKLFMVSLLFSFSFSKPDFNTLLSFKISADISASLPWSSSSHPCSWLGVTCHPTTQRVIKLRLNNLNLTGPIQSLSRLTQLRHLSLHNNHLSLAPPALSSWPNLKHLYLSHNQFSGNFPAGVSHLHRLLRLDLSFNHFSSLIPMNELTQLPYLLTLRLEFNSFTGTLINSNSLSVSSLTDFNVSGNNLSGGIPVFFSTFPLSSFTGNNLQCGKPLPVACSNRTVHSLPVAGDDNGKTRLLDMKMKVSDSVEMMIICVDVVAVILTFIIITLCCYKWRYKYRHREQRIKGYNGKYDDAIIKERLEILESSGDREMLCFEGCKGIHKVDDLLMASAEMLGNGSVGTTYKVVMDGGDTVVVKRVKVRERMVKKKEIDEYLKDNIGGLRDGNILSSRAFASVKDELLLVYDFLPNGSLHTLLHGNRGPGRTPLDWSTRLKISLGSAKGIAFLHSHNNPKLVHGNLTSTNIIIDNLGNACISDIGLNLLLQLNSSLNNHYRAPELEQLVQTQHNYLHIKNYSQKCDVYSFGVILLEILTGKIGTFEGEGNLVNRVRRIMMKENWIWEMFDFELLRYKEMEREMMALLEVALLCLASSPDDRPEIIVVKKMIDEIRVKDWRPEEPVEYIFNGSASDASFSDKSS